MLCAMKTKLTGRQAEQAILQKALQSEEAELVAVIGRRRVGKTFLVRKSIVRIMPSTYLS